MTEVTIKQIMAYFNEGLSEDDPRNKPTRFASEWKALTDADKAQIKAGLSDGSMSY